LEVRSSLEQKRLNFRVSKVNRNPEDLSPSDGSDEVEMALLPVLQEVPGILEPGHLEANPPGLLVNGRNGRTIAVRQELDHGLALRPLVINVASQLEDDP
jgi:hypothetical protein